MVLRESALNGYCPNGKVLVCVFWRKWRFWRGREGSRSIGACSLNSLSSFFLSFLFFSLCFRSYLFSFSLLLCFSFHVVRYILCFSISSTGHGKDLFIVPDVTSVLLSCPLTAFVWSGCTCRPYYATQNPCQTEADSFCPSMRRGLILSFCALRPFLPRC